MAPPPPISPEVLAAAPPKRSRRRGALIALIIVVVLIAGLGGGAFGANAALSGQYSPQRAVADYFAAQARGDVNAMWSNSTYLKGDGSYTQFFDQNELTQMLSLSQNKSITNVKIVSTTMVDSATSSVAVSMSWAGTQRSHTYTVRKDVARVHDLLYYSWRVDIPFATIAVTLPVQGGTIEVDTLSLPAGATPDKIQVIEGYHKVTMQSTDFYDGVSLTAIGVDNDPTVNFLGKLSSTAVAKATSSIKAALVTGVWEPNYKCDTVKYTDCVNHLYYAPVKAYTIYYFTMPGYPEIDYSKYVFRITGDPTVGMTLVVATEQGQLKANGTCAILLTVDGNRYYKFKGTWSASVTVSAGKFIAYVNGYDCENAKA